MTGRGDEFLRFQVTLDCTGPEDEVAVAALRSWFDLGVSTIAATYVARIAAQPPLSAEVFRTGGDYGPGNSAWGQIEFESLTRQRRQRAVLRPYSEREYTRLLAKAADLLTFRGTVPVARILVAMLDPSGRYLRKFDQVSITASLPAPSADTLVLAMEFHPAHLLGHVVAAWRRWVDEHRITFGVIDQALGGVKTALEGSLRDLGYSLIPQVRQRLRGYGWLTIASQEVGDRLGGADALRATGVFAEVARTGSGAYWLQATTDPQAYGMADAEQIFRVLAPTLPPGRPRPPKLLWGEPPYLIVAEDASTVTESGLHPKT